MKPLAQPPEEKEATVNKEKGKKEGRKEGKWEGKIEKRREGGGMKR